MTKFESVSFDSTRNNDKNSKLLEALERTVQLFSVELLRCNSSRDLKTFLGLYFRNSYRIC